MTVHRWIGSAALRLALIYAVVFAVGGGGLYWAIDRAVATYGANGLDSDLRTETGVLLSTDGGQDRSGLERRIDARSRIVSPYVYAVLDSQGHRVAGQFPEGLIPRTGLDEVRLPHAEDDSPNPEEVPVRTLLTPLGDGSLIVGKSTYAILELQELVSWISLWAIGGLSLIAAVAGGVAGTALAQRLDRINRATARIMAGHPAERVPPVGLGSEFETLRSNLNALLDWQQAALEALRHVSSDIAHDLRTPLNRLRQRLDQARTTARGPDVPAAVLEAAITDLDGVLDTFAALLRIAQLEGGTGRTAFGPVQPSEIIERAFEAYQPVCEEAGHALTVSINSAQPVSGDADLLVQLLSNLIENAIVHSGQPTQISLECFDEGDQVVLAVRDSGQGIPASERENVTRRFHRLDASRNTPGSGLGLALVRAIAQLHGGRLVLASNKPGLLAQIYLPRPAEVTG
tara:strand:+ start:20570 stop:21946 length:1377 start_codon:yes stop_codon:yes gene_type:complete